MSDPAATPADPCVPAWLAEEPAAALEVADGTTRALLASEATAALDVADAAVDLEVVGCRL